MGFDRALAVPAITSQLITAHPVLSHPILSHPTLYHTVQVMPERVAYELWEAGRAEEQLVAGPARGC